MRIGMIGLPASGKSIVYRLLTHGQPGQHASRPGEASIAVVKVPDPRLDRLALLFKPKKVTPASIEFIDLPPLVKGSAKEASASRHLLPQMRQADALLAVLRAFKDERVPHSEGRVDPARDAAMLETELLLADLDLVEKRIAKIEEGLRKGRRDESLQELALYRVVRGNRIRLDEEDELELDDSAWHSLRVVQDDDDIRVSLGGIGVMRARDRTFTEGGRAGVWSGGGATAWFDDFRIEPEQDRRRRNR